MKEREGRIIIDANDGSSAAQQATVIRTLLPSADVVESVGAAGVLQSHDVILLVAASEADALDRARTLRARGVVAGIVLVASAIADVRVVPHLAPVASIKSDEAAGAALLDAIAQVHGEEHQSAIMTALRRTRQLLAAGEVAMRLQHSLNNPLTALMAEAQLMELEAESEEQREACGRLVAQCRRMMEIIRRLDGIGASRV